MSEQTQEDALNAVFHAAPDAIRKVRAMIDRGLEDGSIEPEEVERASKIIEELADILDPEECDFMLIPLLLAIVPGVE